MPGSRRATVLVVDDEPQVLEVMEIMLVRAGFAVLTAASAEDALEVLSKSPRPVRLALCDIKLPGMDGYELATRIRKLSPETGIILTSGFDEQRVLPGVPFIPKPFSTWQLLEAVETALELKQTRLAAGN